MARPYKMTKEIREKLIGEFTKMIKNAKMYNGHLEVKKDYKWEDGERAVLQFTQLAWTKMLTVINHFDTEVGWHCTAERIDDNTYRIIDLLFYPQEVTGATVNTDDEAWKKWEITDEYNAVANQVLAHGHSHVNMGVTPSGQDNAHWSELIKTVSDDGFYILMIWNKKMQYTINIYNMRENTIFETADIDIEVEGFDLADFFKQVDSRVKTRAIKPASSYPTYPSYPGSTYSGKSSSKSSKGQGFYDALTGTFRYDD